MCPLPSKNLVIKFCWSVLSGKLARNICGGNSIQYIHGGYIGNLKLPKRNSTKDAFLGFS